MMVPVKVISKQVQAGSVFDGEANTLSDQRRHCKNGASLGAGDLNT